MAQRVHESIEVRAQSRDVFSYWSNRENVSKVMRNVEEVRMTGQDAARRAADLDPGPPEDRDGGSRR